MNEENYFSNIFNLYENDGKLYAAITNFSLEMLVGKGEYVGNSRTLTMNELYQMTEEDVSFEYFTGISTYHNILILLLNRLFPDLVDFENQCCKFNSDEFLVALKYCKEYGTEDRPESYTTYQNGETLFRTERGLSAFDYAYYQLLFQNDVSLMGFPSLR